MIESIEIENLRGIAHGKLEELTPLTIIVGPNGTGKSTILEAILLSANNQSSNNNFRQYSPSNNEWLINKPFVNNIAKIFIRYNENDFLTTIETPDKLKKELHIRKKLKQKFFKSIVVNPGGSIRGEEPAIDFQDTKGTFDAVVINMRSFINFDKICEDYSKSVSMGYRKTIFDYIKSIHSNIDSIEILMQGDKPILHFVFPGYSVPANLSGEGIYSLLRMCIELALNENKIILIEEPEIHQHVASLKQISRLFFRAIKEGTQLIITTHSLELIDSILEEFNNSDLSKLGLFMVKLENGELKSAHLSGESIEVQRHVIGADLR